MIKFMTLCCAIVLACSVQLSAQLVTGAPTFTTPPTSTIGTVTSNTLVITPNPNGFVVSGQVGITMPPTTSTIAGILAAWEIDYPVDPLYGFNPALFTTTTLDGFVLPPVGVFGNTGGAVTSSIVTLPGTTWPGSSSVVQMGLINGIDNPAWTPAITVSSPPFAFTSAAGMVVRQRFTLDGVYNSGPGGVWLIDVPVTTVVTAIPEPSTYAMMVILVGVTGIVVYRRRRQLILVT